MDSRQHTNTNNKTFVILLRVIKGNNRVNWKLLRRVTNTNENHNGRPSGSTIDTATRDQDMNPDDGNSFIQLVFSL